MEEFLNKDYVLEKSENFEEYLKNLGHGYLHRKAAMTLKPVHRLTLNEEGTYTFTMTSLLANSKVTFKPGEEFDEVKPPGDKLRSTVTFEGNTMEHIQRESNGRVSRHRRVFTTDQMIVTTTVDGTDLLTVRYHRLVPPS